MSTPARPLALTESEWLTFAVLLGGVFVMATASLAAAVGLSIRPWPILGLSIVLTSVTWASVASGPGARPPDVSPVRLVGVLLVLIGFTGYVAWLAWPTLYPIAEGPDLVHHLTLAHFIQRRHVLPADFALGPYLGEMTGYPPGSHVLAALAGDWIGVDAIRLVHPVMALAVGVKAALVFHVIVRLRPRDACTVPSALAGTCLLLAPHAYLLQPVTFYGFYSQVVAETFAVATLWALVVWFGQPARRWLVVFAICGVGVALSWPVFVPVPALALTVLALLRREPPWRGLVDLAIGLGPIALVVGAFAAARSGAAGILSSGGDVLTPAAHLFGWPLLALMAGGIVVAARRRREQVPLLVFSSACLAQVGGLVALQHVLHATNYYLGFKTVHLLVYPLVVFAAIGLAAGWSAVADAVRPAWRTALGRAAWALPVVVVVLLARTDLPTKPLPSPITQPVHHAGVWARTHVPPNCVDYLVEHWLTAYWLHLDVLGNARTSARIDRHPYDFHRTMGGWVGSESMRYAIVGEWDIVPRDAREHMRVLERFGPAAVAERIDGRGDCSDRTPGIDRIGSESVSRNRSPVALSDEL